MASPKAVGSTGAGAGAGTATSGSTDMLRMAAVLGLMGAAVGVGVGLVIGAVGKQRRKAAEERAALAMPHLLASIPDLADPLVAFAAHVNRFDEPAFRALCRKLDNMLMVLQWLQEAPSDALQPAHQHLGTEYAAGVNKYLHQFYSASGVLLVKTSQTTDGWASTGLVPLRRDLRETHEQFVTTVDLVAKDMDAMASAKIRETLMDRA
jgi:hypothetical protein